MKYKCSTLWTIKEQGHINRDIDLNYIHIADELHVHKWPIHQFAQLWSTLYVNTVSEHLFIFSRTVWSSLMLLFWFRLLCIDFYCLIIHHRIKNNDFIARNNLHWLTLYPLITTLVKHSKILLMMFHRHATIDFVKCKSICEFLKHMCLISWRNE